jgi:RNA polymerase primary sigma factor
MPSLCESRERQLLRDARSGSREARERIVRDHERALRATAARYCGLGLPLEDLVQEGAIGLLAAIDSYDDSRGTTFQTFARSHVRHAMADALTARGRLVRLPKQVVERQRAVARAASALAVSSGHQPTPDEIGAAAGLPVDAVEAVRALPTPPVSLDGPISEDGCAMIATIEDTSAADPEAEAVAHHRAEVIADALARLPARQRYVIERRYGFRGAPASLVDVSHELHLCSQRTRSIEQAGLFRLAKMLESDPTFSRPTWTAWATPTLTPRCSNGRPRRSSGRAARSRRPPRR